MKAIYAGSFDPYTNGHKSIIKKASKMFDEVHIVIASNRNKKREFEAITMADAIRDDLKAEGIDNCVVRVYSGLVAIYCKHYDIDVSVRGLRNNMDYNYEENISEVNKLINSELETIYLRADTKAISSSMVKELLAYHQDVKQLVPESVYNILN